MRPHRIALATLTTLALGIGVNADATAHPDPHSHQAACPQGAPCPGDPTCIVYPGPGDCHNSGRNAALEMFGCVTDLEGNYRYAWAGITGRGILQIKFRVPIYTVHSEYIGGKENRYIEFDGGKKESANRVYVTESSSVRLQVAWLECCECATPGEARAFYLKHVAPLIRND